MNITKFLTRIILGAAFLFFVFFSTIVSFITDWWWFTEVGYTEVFVKSLTAKLVLGLAVTIFAALFLLVNFLLAVSSKIPWLATLPESLIGQPVTLDNRIVKKLGTVACLLIALFLGLFAATGWHDVLKYLNSTPFGLADPILGKDISFYIFTLPVFDIGLGLVRTLILFSLIGCGAVYVLRGSLNTSGLLGKLGETNLSKLGLQTTPHARIHMGILLFLFLLTLAAGTYLSLFKLLTSQGGPVFGAVFTDVNIMIPLLRVSILVTLFAAFSSLYWGIRGKAALLLGSITFYFLVGVAQGFIPAIFQKLIVAPNELAKETPFIINNIAATRAAFGLDKIEEREISGDKPLKAQDLASNNLTIKNVRLWDRAPLLSTFSQIQEIRTYYEFASVDNDRYTIDGEIRQIMLSLRELASESLPNRSWINERLTFTHGYGLAAGPVNQVTTEGLPVLFVKDLPPKSEAKELTVNRPEIYYGELSNDYVFVKTKSKEFDYPKGEENVFTTYGGKGGVEINSPIRRLFYAIRLGSLKLLLSNDITSESRILYNRKINERIAKIAPFLTLDRDPYAVVADGRIYWIADAYTASDSYPYSQPLSLNGSRVNYIRNSVKVVLDAYDGTVTFYQADANDPIIRTYARIFPKVFKPLSELPKSLVPHLRYPEDIFTLQTAIYTTYHMDDPQIFYNKEDQWEIPSVATEGEKNTSGKLPVMTPRHMIMKLPGESKEEYILMLPFTPRAKDNLSAWMVARNDAENYGKLLVYRFPKQKLIFGPKQVIGRINQDAEIARQISLWDQRGSQVIQGPLLVIPIEESLIYVRPLYLKAEAGKIPELKRVIVAYENKIAMEETLEAGLSRIFGTGVSKTVPSTPLTQDPPTGQAGLPAGKADIDEIIKQANEVYETAIRAQKEGDWAKYGEEIRRLGEILNKRRR